MKTVLFVCTGDTCRGPLAAALFNKIAPQKLGLRAESAGLFACDNAVLSQNAIAAAKALGCDISSHKSRMLSHEIGEQAERLVCLTAAHRDRILEKYPHWLQKTICLTINDISDSFGGTELLYQKTAQDISRAIESMLRKGTLNDA